MGGGLHGVADGGADGGADTTAFASWPGHVWVQSSILEAVLKKDERSNALCLEYPCLKYLDLSLRKLLWPTAYRQNRLTAEMIQSLSLRPGLQLRRKADPRPEDAHDGLRLSAAKR